MSTLRRMTKFKVKNDNVFLEEPSFIKKIKCKKIHKDAKKNTKPIIQPHDDEISDFISSHSTNNVIKKRKVAEDGKESKQKLLFVMKNQLETRKQGNTKLFKSLSDTVGQLEADHEALKENEQKLEQIAGILVKCIQQASTAQRQNVHALKHILDSFKKEVEGLLTRGAMKPDDRPLWFDVYKAFPPITEPKFARPKPEIKPIRAILYREDVTRVKFHTHGHGLGAVNMLNNPSGDTQTKRLLQEYDKLKSQGVVEEELIQKTVEAAAAARPERQSELPSLRTIPKESGSISAQVLDQANIKDIFKD